MRHVIPRLIPHQPRRLCGSLFRYQVQALALARTMPTGRFSQTGRCARGRL